MYKDHLAVSNRIILLKLKSQKIDVNLIQVYAPTMDSNENAIQRFYKDLDATKKKCKSGEMLLVMGDWNAKIGCSMEQPTIGGYGLGGRNEREDLLIDWCHENSMVATNTWFKIHPRRLYEWISPGDLTRNQNDYILSEKRFRNSILNCKTYPQADCNTDHILLVATLRLQLKTCTKSKITLKKDYSIYKQKEIIKNIHTKTETALLRQQVVDNNDVNECYELFKQVTTTAEEEVPLLPKKEQESWMTPEIKDLLKDRRNTKYDSVEYKNLNKLIKSKCICAHEEYLDKKCEKTEALYRFNPKQAHKRIKELKRKKFTNLSGIIKDKDGTILFEENDIKRRWLEYVKELYDEPNRSVAPLYFKEPLNGSTILKGEIQNALSYMRNRKALG